MHVIRDMTHACHHAVIITRYPCTFNTKAKQEEEEQEEEEF
jgi:hypothetical protein